jgi:hypothetical protein
VGPTKLAILEPSDFSPGVTQREVRELEGGFSELKELSISLNWMLSSYWSTLDEAVKSISAPASNLPITPFSRHSEISQEVPGRPPRTGPPWNLLILSRYHSLGVTGA